MHHSERIHYHAVRSFSAKKRGEPRQYFLVSSPGTRVQPYAIEGLEGGLQASLGRVETHHQGVDVGAALHHAEAEPFHTSVPKATENVNDAFALFRVAAHRSPSEYQMRRPAQAGSI